MHVLFNVKYYTSGHWVSDQTSLKSHTYKQTKEDNANTYNILLSRTPSIGFRHFQTVIVQTHGGEESQNTL